MADTAPSSSSALKDWFDPARHRSIAAELAGVCPRFDQRRFLAMTLDGLEQRELLERMRQMARALDASLPGAFREKVAVLQQVAPRIGHSFVAITLCEFVAQFGLDDAAFSLRALRDLTRYGSAEFAVRPFLVRDLTGTLAIMRGWATDSDEHVRRLASEGCRPRLPWGTRVPMLIREPGLTAPILEQLKADPSLYVRKSVANHLNDLSKDHPDFVLDRVESWDRRSPATAWIVRHALRTLVKRGHPRALALLGARSAAADACAVIDFDCTPRRLRLGDSLTLRARLRSTAATPELWVIDYVVHYQKANGQASPKVFKWRVAPVAAGGSLELEKRQILRDFTTRRHYPGEHRVELQVNGRRIAASRFRLVR